MTPPVRVDKGIKMPSPDMTHGGRRSIYPWRDMEIGDSFLFPETMSSTVASSYAATAGKNMNRKFATRKIGRRVRCWRIE